MGSSPDGVTVTFAVARPLARGGPALAFDAAPAPADGDGWLGPDERRRLAAMRFEKRRRDFRAGRWVLHRLLARELLDVADPDPDVLARVDVRPDAEGAPVAFLDGSPVGCRVSLSHREGAVLAAVARPDDLLGVDLEHDEPRTPAFAAEWLAPPEIATLAGLTEPTWSRRVHLYWTAKEAALKALGTGLRLDPRRCVVRLSAPDRASTPLEVRAPEGPPLPGWATARGRWIAALVHRAGT